MDLLIFLPGLLPTYLLVEILPCLFASLDVNSVLKKCNISYKTWWHVNFVKFKIDS